MPCFPIVTIPSSVTSLGANSFTGAPDLLSFTVHSSNNNFSSSNGILFNKPGTTLVRYPATKGTTYAIPETVTSIGSYAFYKTQMTNVTMPTGVTNIGAFAFRDNELTSVTIPSSVTSIGAWAFATNSLASVNFLGNAPPEQEYIFDSNPGLTVIDALTGSTGWGSTFSGLPVRVSTVGTPPVETPPAPAVAPTPTPVVAPAPAPVVSPTPSAAKTPSLAVVGTPVPITRTPSAAIASAVAIGVNKTKVMVALKVPIAKKAANQVTKYVIRLKTSKGVTITRTISVKPGRSVSPTLTGKKKTSYSMTVTAVTKSGKKTTWKGPRVKTS
jgi:hypothetical protein